MSWMEAREAWSRFEEGVDKVRYKLHCSSSVAWFRGHNDADHQELIPRLFRMRQSNTVNDDPDRIRERRKVGEQTKHLVADHKRRRKERADIKAELLKAYLAQDKEKGDQYLRELRRVQLELKSLKKERWLHAHKSSTIDLPQLGER